MPSIDKIKGRYLFGVNAATSILPQAGSGSLTYTAGAGGATFNSNYVDLKQGSRFTTPFNSTSRDRTIICVGMLGFKEEVYDTGDATLKWPVVVAPVGLMTLDGVLMGWGGGGFVTNSGPNFAVDMAGGSTFPVNGTYEPVHSAFGYRDSTFNFIPQIMIFGQGADGVGTYMGFTAGRELAWLTNNAAYTGAAAAGVPTQFGSTNYGGGAGGSATIHTPILGFAEYSYLTKAEALEAATEMVVLLEARGWTGIFHNPVTSE